jgi:glycosyltransferase involved in cell wall biosynthesis
MTLGRLVEGLSRSGIEVTVVAPSRKDRPTGTQGSHTCVSVPGIPIPRYSELRFGLPARRRLRRLWSTGRPDVVHIATEGPLGWSALSTATRLGIPVVSSFHTNFHNYGDHYGFGFMQKGVLRWLRSFHNRTLRTFAPSDDLIKSLSQTGFKNLRLFARGVDTELYGPHRRDAGLRQSWQADDETPVALYVGRLAGEKNLDLVISAWAQMREQLPGLRLVLVGDGPDRKRIEKRVPQAVFAGMQRGEALAAHYASADVFLFASVTETFGNVVTEAMASALPVLAYDYAAPGRFIRSGINGLLAPFGDEEAFLKQAARLARVRASWPDLGAAARQTVLPHSWEAIVDSYVQELSALHLS